MPGDDAFGRALLDWARGGTDPEIIERDDGFVDAGAGPEVYLAPLADWPSCERQALRYARGRVIDVGCGAGRVALELQSRRFEVTGVDHSPLAVRASRARGVERVRLALLESLGSELPGFDTMVLFGNNFGIAGTPERTRTFLTEWAAAMPSSARILAESMDRRGSPPWHRAYHRRPGFGFGTGTGPRTGSTGCSCPEPRCDVWSGAPGGRSEGSWARRRRTSTWPCSSGPERGVSEGAAMVPACEGLDAAAGRARSGR
jgi:SAM-dependent methyltransferase